MDENFLVNLAIGVKFDTCSSEFWIDCLQIGDEHYQNFKMNRLVNKTEKLFDPMHKVRSKQSLRQLLNQMPSRKKQLLL